MDEDLKKLILEWLSKELGKDRSKGTFVRDGDGYRSLDAKVTFKRNADGGYERDPAEELRNKGLNRRIPPIPLGPPKEMMNPYPPAIGMDNKGLPMFEGDARGLPPAPPAPEQDDSRSALMRALMMRGY